MKRASLAILCSAAFFCSARAGEEAVKFAAEPKVTAEKDGVRIEFAVDRLTDVAVEILDAKGETIRHLAAGVLGDNAPEPLAKGLAQSLVWDRKDDLGKDLPAGNYSVRVGLGLKAGLKEVTSWSPLALGGIRGVVSLPEGGVGLLGNYWPGTMKIVTLDSAGRFARQLYPPPANVSPESLGDLKCFTRGDGRSIPMFAGSPATPKMGNTAAYVCLMARAGKRLVFFSSGQNPPCVIDTESGAFSFPKVEPTPEVKAAFVKNSPAWIKHLFGGYVYAYGLAASPDGKSAYVSAITPGGYFDPKGHKYYHAVFRFPLDGGGPFEVFAGALAESGKSEARLNTPAGLATDKDGNLYVCDRGNDRIAVFDPGGKFVRAFDVKAPGLVQVHSGNGNVYVVSGGGFGARMTLGLRSGLRLLKFAPDGRELAALDLPKDREYKRIFSPNICMALDAARDPAVVWLGLQPEGYETEGGVARIQDKGGAFGDIQVIDTHFRKFDARYVNNTPNYPPYKDALEYNYFSDEGAPFFSLSPDAKGLWADGNLYARKNWAVPGGLQRMRADKSAFPFESLGTNVLEVAEKVGSPWHPNRGTMVDRRGHVYLRYTYAHDQKGAAGGKDGAMTTGIEHYGPDGKKLGTIHLSNSTYGLGVDPRGNIYVGDKPRPPGVTVPADIEKAFNGKVPQGIVDSYGCVLKFGPEGGTYVWKKGKATGTTPREKGDLWKVPPSGLDAFDNYGRSFTADLKGAKWMWLGMSPIPTYYSCICAGTEMGVDPHGRIFAPDGVACRVAVLDSGGNLIRYVGAYGNMNSRGKGSPVPDPEIAFASIAMVVPSATSRQFRVVDSNNGWVAVISLGYEQEAKAPVPAGN